MSKKAKKLSDKEAVDLVLMYLNEQNRPFSHKLVFENLHGKDIGLGQAKVTKILEDLAASGKINTKDRFGAIDEGLLKELDVKAATLKEELQELKEEIAPLEKRNKDLADEPLDEGLVKDLERLHSEKIRLDAIKGGGRKIDAMEKQRLDKLHIASKKEWKTRKRLFSEMAGTFEENLEPKKFKKLREDLGIETDEAVGVHPDKDKVSQLIKKNMKS